jgi:CUG-BP- and ETR3-like factor
MLYSLCQLPPYVAYLFQGCNAPIVVKFADTQKEKEQKKLNNMTANLWNLSVGGLGALGPQYIAVSDDDIYICL